jgi:hypothetical protein
VERRGGAVVEGKSHKATVKGDVNALRWLDPFLGGKDLATISRATLDRLPTRSSRRPH